MARKWKIFRDPVHTFISFDKEEEDVILNIIRTPIFQRLRRIKQLGFSELTYPTATHTRFSHSLGVAYLLGEIIEKLKMPQEKISLKVVVGKEEKEVVLEKKQLKLLLRLVGLLHDVGHGPFSHAFERLIGGDYSHERMTINIIRNSEITEEIRKSSLLREIKDVVPEIICGVLRGEVPIEHYWLKELISSQLDADRMDYLLRDAYMCGVPYGIFDLKWMITHLQVEEIKQEERWGIVLNAEKGTYTVEAFILSRYHMYEQVYFHKTTRAFECLLIKIFERIKQLMQEDKQDELFGDDECLLNFIKNPEDLNSFRFLDDTYLWYYLNKWARKSSDRILSRLAMAILSRKPPKLIKEFKESTDIGEFMDWEVKFKDLIGKLKREDEELEYIIFMDSYRNIPFKDAYLLGETPSERAEKIWLLKDGKVLAIEVLSPMLEKFKNLKLNKTRFYVDRDFYNTYYKAFEEFN